MASFEKALTKDLFDSLLPKYGTPRKKMPIWDEGQKMFLINGHQTDTGNMYYEAIRFCENIVIKEKVGLFHTWTYIDSLEIYAFNGISLELVQKRDYHKTFRNEDIIRSESVKMLCDFFAGCMKVQQINVDPEQIKKEAERLVAGCFKSFLAPDFNKQRTRILPQLDV